MESTANRADWAAYEAGKLVQTVEPDPDKLIRFPDKPDEPRRTLYLPKFQGIEALRGLYAKAKMDCYQASRTNVVATASQVHAPTGRRCPRLLGTTP